MTDFEQQTEINTVVDAAAKDAQQKGWFGFDGLAKLFTGKVKKENQDSAEQPPTVQNQDEGTW